MKPATKYGIIMITLEGNTGIAQISSKRELTILKGENESNILSFFHVRERQTGQIKLKSEAVASVRAWRFICPAAYGGVVYYDFEWKE